MIVRRGLACGKMVTVYICIPVVWAVVLSKMYTVTFSRQGTYGGR